jgi:Domain of unknown function (DUF1611_C) P-loop domain
MSQSQSIIQAINNAHRSFATRNADLGLAAGVDRRKTPEPGDLCLVTVTRVGQHKHVELTTGRRAPLAPGDQLVLVYGNRYATDQFEAIVPETIAPCHLAAAGGIAAAVVSRHATVRPPTEITPSGILCDANGVALNLRRWAWPGVASSQARGVRQHLVLVVGSSMNAGKTTTCANLVKTLKACGLKTAALKLTGTGSGGDIWRYLDAGAFQAMDFGNVGLASTAGMDLRELEAAVSRLCAAVSPEADIIVGEVADGVLQRETQHLLQSAWLRQRADSVVYAAGDPLSAAAGVQLLGDWGLDVAAVSGLMCASPLAVREFRSFMNAPVIFAEQEDPHSVIARVLNRTQPSVSQLQAS